MLACKGTIFKAWHL